jgi:hypothetical protein
VSPVFSFFNLRRKSTSDNNHLILATKSAYAHLRRYSGLLRNFEHLAVGALAMHPESRSQGQSR